jgi:hypothetical protein
MRVACIKNRAFDLPTQVQHSMGLDTGFVFEGVAPGSTYTVYAMSMYDGIVSYRTDGGSIEYPAHLFEVTDPRLSCQWLFAEGEQHPARSRYAHWGYREYLTNAHRLALVNGEDHACTVFSKWKEMLDCEFDDPRGPSAVALADAWVQCHRCANAWEADTRCGLIVCPQCRATQNNPIKTPRGG